MELFVYGVHAVAVAELGIAVFAGIGRELLGYSGESRLVRGNTSVSFDKYLIIYIMVIFILIFGRGLFIEFVLIVVNSQRLVADIFYCVERLFQYAAGLRDLCADYRAVCVRGLIVKVIIARFLIESDQIAV